MEQKAGSQYKDAVFHGMIGVSDAMKDLFHRIEVYAQALAPVVVTGETGTGKELIARAIHGYSPRRQHPFVALNCTALNEELLESELFGHERGAFTGAVREHRGRFERANKGSLFLDEIGDMPLKTQVKLLRVLEEKKLERIGGELEIPIDVRIIAATNVSLEQTVSRGQFRADLYHRLAVLRIHVPPLRERHGDLPLLVQYFLDILNRRYGKNITRLSPNAMKLLEEYHWPGNIRELRNVLERVYVETQGKMIGRNAFREWEVERNFLAAGQWSLGFSETQRLARTPIVPPIDNRQRSGAGEWYAGSQSDVRDQNQYFIPSRYNTYRRALPAGGQPMDNVVDGEFRVRESVNTPRKFTAEILRKAYREAGGNISRAARLLGIHKSTFYRQMQKLNLSREDIDQE